MPYSLALVDFDGTLADSMPYWLRLPVDTLREAGIPQPDGYENYIRSIPMWEIARETEKTYPQLVEELTKRLGNATAGVLVDYKGITVLEDTALRRELRAAGIEYTVVKNTLLRFAVDKCNYNEFDSVLNGTTSLATTECDPIAPIRIVSEFAKKMNGKFDVKGGFMEGKVLPMSELDEIAQLPSKDALYSKVLGTMLAPITSLAVVLGQILEQKGGSLETAEAAAE